MKLAIKISFITLLLIAFSSCVTRVHHRPVHKKYTVVKVAPRGHKIVTVKGRKYYKWNNTHYKKTRNGYVLVKL